MATTFYFPSSGAAPATPAVHSAWDHTASSFVRRPLILTTASDTDMLNKEWTISGDSLASYVGLQFVSDELDAQTISGTMSCFIMGRITITGVTFFTFHARVITSAGATRGVLLDRNDSTVDAFHNSSYRWQGHSGVAISSVICSAGDRLVIELGCYTQNTSSKTCGLKYGDDTAVSDIAASDSTGSATRKGSAVFSDTITFTPTGALEYDYYEETVRLGNPITANTSSLAAGTYTVQSGSLPPGVSLDASTGTISGTPTTRGTYTVVIDRNTTHDSQSITWRVTSNIVSGPIDL
jgi:hypothetical protein